MRPQMAMSVVPLSYLELKTTCPFHFTSQALDYREHVWPSRIRQFQFNLVSAATKLHW
jgi:hypothetical protein